VEAVKGGEVTRIIKTAAAYKAALREAKVLVKAHPSPGSEKADRLELLAFLLERYEKEHFSVGKPTALEAIQFRMEQRGLAKRDLVPYFGSASRVSEVLSGKRELTLKMIRALHKGLGIPAEVLLQAAVLREGDLGLQWDRLPVREMARRGWFPGFDGTPSQAEAHAPQLAGRLIERAGFDDSGGLWRRQHVRSGSAMDRHALFAWSARAAELASGQKLPATYAAGCIDKAFMSGLVRLSLLDEGPRLAREYLGKRGVHLIVLAHLPGTHLDGAAMLLSDGSPVVALTLRYDRLDNFWFSLCHELGHVVLHLGPKDSPPYFDDLELGGDAPERDADRFAERALIPARSWATAPVRRDWRPATVRAYADRLGVDPAIVAGRVRREQGNYRMLWSLVGKGEVKKHFQGLESGVA
jgi:HTH-type transcriptional regulator/antitoxin HigA